jgi:hypothetical protein
MVADFFLNFFHGLLEPLVSVLPTGHLPEEVGSVWNGFAGWIGSVDQLVPIAAPMQFMVGLVLATVPAFVTYRVGVFIYNKVRGS